MMMMMMMRHFLGYVVCLSLFYLATYGTLVESLNVKVAGRNTECFENTAKSGDIIHLDFEVIDGDDFEMQATITDVEDPGTALKTFNTFSVRTEWTADSEGNREEYRYKLCFKNMLYMESRMVSFSWHVNQDELLRAAHSEHLEGKLKSRVNMLWEEIDTVRDLVHYFGLQQNNQHRMNQDTNTRVMWASAFEVFAVIAMTTMQIYALKSTLERRRRV